MKVNHEQSGSENGFENKNIRWANYVEVYDMIAIRFLIGHLTNSEDKYFFYFHI